MASQRKQGDVLARLSSFEKNAIRKMGRGEYAGAEACLRSALRLLNRVAPAPTPDHLNLWNQSGMVCKYLGKYDRAEKYYRLALRYTPQCLDEGHARTFFLASLYHNLGGLQHSRRRFRRGERYARKGLQLRQTLGRTADAAAASDMVALAAILDGLRKFSESEKLYKRALRVYRRVYGQRHAEIAVLLNNLAALYHATGRPKPAEATYLAALDMKRRVLVSTHPDIAVTMNNLAMLHRSQGHRAAALRWLKRSLAILTVSLGPRHPSTRSVRSNLGLVETPVSAGKRILS